MELERTVTETEALLAWISNLDFVGQHIRTTGELSDGTIIWEILHDIDRSHFSAIDTTSSDLENLAQIHGQLVQYIAGKWKSWPGGLDPRPNLEVFAEKHSTREADKLLKLVFFAAIAAIEKDRNRSAYGTNHQAFEDAIVKLDEPTQECLHNIIIEAENGNFKLEEPDGLVKEERESQLVKEIEILQLRNQELQEQNQEKEQRVAELEFDMQENEKELVFEKRRLENLLTGKDEGQTRRGQNSQEVIANLESELTRFQDENVNLSNQIAALISDSKRHQELQDKYDIVKSQRDDFARDAEATKKYRQKVEELQGCDRENQSFKKEIERFREQVLKYDAQTHMLNGKLKECENALARSEQQCNDIYVRKREVDHDNEELKKRLDGYENQVRQLEGRLNEHDGPDYEYKGSPGSVTPTTGAMTPIMQGNLQKDLEAAGFEESTLSLGYDDKHDLVDGTEGSSRLALDEIAEQTKAMQEEDKARIREEMLKPLEEVRKGLARFVAEHTGENSEAIQQSLEYLTKQVSDLIEKNHERLAQRAQYIHQQNEQIKNLRDRVSELEKGADDDSRDGDSEEDTVSKERELELQKQIDSLSRELALISSSWYELQGKLHNTNNVPISRYRHGSAGLVDAQKGWMARQRTAVAGR
ncbi:hypothetical protein BJX99DRAFT_225292 [Aspergillus californicus]